MTSYSHSVSFVPQQKDGLESNASNIASRSRATNAISPFPESWGPRRLQETESRYPSSQVSEEREFTELSSEPLVTTFYAH